MAEVRGGTNGRLLAKLVRELVRSQAFETVADMVDVLKYRCARLHVRWTADDVSDAIRMVESNCPLTLAPVAPADAQDATVYVSRAEAAVILQRLGVTL